MRYYLFILVLGMISCNPIQNPQEALFRQELEQQLRNQTQLLVTAEIADDLPAFIRYYDEHAISMPEYQLTLHGHAEINRFYSTVFRRQAITSFQKTANEFIHMDSTIVEIGTFKKKYSLQYADSSVTLTGKYWHVWQIMPDGNPKLKGESFGYFHSVVDPASLVMDSLREQPDEWDLENQQETPFELKAYNALMEKGVRTRDGILRARFFTTDGVIFPFADTTVTGMDQIKPYLIAYCSRGKVTIDSIQCYTYAFERQGDYILEYDMFKVKWQIPDFTGRTEGKGIRIWKRQPDQSLRLYREIGTHNHLP
ncbi:MAG TPA: hypothetical protein VGK59_10190 [Ohtaekwangia sp.]